MINFAGELLKETLFRAQADDSIDRVGRAVGGGVEVTHLEFAEETDSHHLNSSEDENSGDDEDGTVERHNVLAGEELQDQEPDGHAQCR